MDFFQQSIEKAEETLKTDAQKGLQHKEAEKRLAENGPNRLDEGKSRTRLEMFIDQFKDFSVLILIIASIVSLFLQEWINGLVILAIVILNAFLGMFQENKANNALKALKDLASPKAKVIRDHKIIKIPSEQLVAGDLVVLEAGDYIPADLRLTQTANLKIDESALTGESLAVEKNAEAVVEENAGLGDRINSAYMSTIVTYGRGHGIVTGAGMDTEIGKIAKMLSAVEDEATPLQKKLDAFGKVLGIICIGVCLAIFVLGFLRGDDLLDIFMTAVALAVAAIPEGLTVVVTVILALGMQKMVKKDVIVKRLSAVETLGSTTVICSDKTGTLTQNKMTVVKIADGFDTFAVTGTGYSAEGEIILPEDEEGSQGLSLLIKAAVLCNDASFLAEEKNIIGDPTEGALLVLGAKDGIGKQGLDEAYPRIQEIPFDSDRKLMSTFHKVDNFVHMYTKGAPDVVLSRCSRILDKNGVRPLEATDKDSILAQNQDFGSEALRVLAFAYKEMDVENTDLSVENDLIFLGIVGMIDPPREEVKQAVAVCKKAGIKAIMITGDHKITATAIGKALGIIDDESQAVNGSELDLLSQEQLQEIVKKAGVFARVSPEHKVRLVEAVRANQDIVAMTGDGVNDAPALKKADIGVAMGITGTDVSKEAADMILTDDNFASIVDAVEEGRVIYSNIRKVVSYLLSCNIGEILLVFFAILLGWDAPLVAIQLLSINLITDAFPAFALGMEAKEPGVMELKPRDPNEPIVDKTMRLSIAIQSISLGFASLLSYWIGLRELGSVQAARTCCFITVVIGELLRAYSSRSERFSVLNKNFFGNSFLNKSVLFSLVFLFASVYVPFLQPVFDTVALSFYHIDLALLCAFIPFVGGELAKLVVRKLYTA